MTSNLRAFVEAVRTATDILAVIGKDVKFHQCGGTLTGLSPFNSEKTPSFVVFPDTQSWYDFSKGGGRGGDVFAYVQQRDGVAFMEALSTLADEAGIRRPNQSDAALRQERDRLVERRNVEQMLTQAAEYYHRALPQQICAEWYRDHYGFNQDTVDTLRLGWATGSLFEHFIRDLEVDRDIALKTGLFVVVRGDRVVDFFQRRLVFPYWRRGQVVYLIARQTQHTGSEPWDRAKYKKLLTHADRHSYVSETVCNDAFYNEDAAHGASDVLITEGVTDCISAYQAGIACISPVTTRFRTRDVPKLIELTRSTRRLVICNDAEVNGAGLAGALDTATALHRSGRDVRIAELPRASHVDKIDVNEFLKAHGPEVFRTLLAGAPRLTEHLIAAIPAETSKLDLSAHLRPVLSLLATVPAIEQEGYVDRIVARFGVGRRAVNALLVEVAASRPGEQVSGDVAPAKEIHGDPLPGRAGAFKGQVHEAQDHYYVVDRHGDPVGISSFRIEPTERIRLDGGEIIVGDVTTDRGRVSTGVRFPREAWRSTRDLLSALPTADMQWTGTDANVQGVLRMVAARQLPIRQETDTLGYVETADGPRWVAPDYVLGEDGARPEDVIAFCSNGSTLPERVHYRSPDLDSARRIAPRVLTDLLALNEPGVLLPVLGWFFATPFRPRLLKLLEHFPILWVWGTQGSGKSTLVKEVFWRLFGVTSTEPYSATETEFALIKLLSSTNAVPVFLDEYRPADMPPRRLHVLHRFLRRLYGGEVEERGRANLTVTHYRLSAPVCVAGEARPDDPALVDRLVSVTPDRNRLDACPDYVSAYRRIQSVDLSVLTSPYLQWTLGRDTEADLTEAVDLADEVLEEIPGGRSVSLRCRDNLRVVVFGIKMFHRFAEHLGVTGLPAPDLRVALSASIVDLMDGEHGAKSPLDLFVETCSVLAHTGRLFDGQHYVIVDGMTCLHFRSCWECYLEHQRRVGQEVPADRRVIRRMLRENLERGGYVKELSKTVELGDRRLRTVALDLDRAAEFLEIDPFPERSEDSDDQAF